MRGIEVSVTLAMPWPNDHDRLVVASIPRTLYTSIAINTYMTPHFHARAVVAGSDNWIRSRNAGSCDR